MPVVNLQFQMGQLPEGFSGTPQEFADILASRLAAVVNGEFLTGQIGGTIPTTDVGLYVDSSTGKVMVWNETQGKYVTVSDVPIGAMQVWPSSNTPPDGWLICSGQTLARAEYPDLFAVLGETWGTNSSLDFKLPKPQGRVPYAVGQGNFADNFGAPRSDKTKEIFLGRYGGFDFPFFISAPASSANFNSSFRSQIQPVNNPGYFWVETTQPCFGVNWIIKAI